MSDQRTGGAGFRLRAGHWVLIVLVVLVIAALIVVVARRSSPGAPVAQPTGSPTPAASSSSPAIDRADCVPTIVGAGVADPTESTPYGVVYASSCDQVVHGLRFTVTAVDSAGKMLSQVTATGGVLFPGEQLGVAGELDPPSGTKIADVQVKVTQLVSSSPAEFSGWAHVQVADLTRGKSDAVGTIPVTGSLRAQPSSAPLCLTDLVFIGRTSSGKVVYGKSLEAANPVTFSIPPVPGLDLSHSAVYAPQVPGVAPSAGAACDGRKLS